MAVLRAVGDRAEDRQALISVGEWVTGMVVVEEAYGSQPQFRHLLQDTNHLPPHRPGAEHHGGHAPQPSRIRMLRTMLSPRSGSTTAKARQRGGAQPARIV